MNKSFTLIEILIVIVVIGVLSAFILVGMSSITQKANIAKGQAFINSMDNALLIGRVSQWKLDDRPDVAPFITPDAWGLNTGTLMDVDGNCSTTKCPQLVTSGCSSGNCLFFDGVNDYINCGSGSNLSMANVTTISVWVKIIGLESSDYTHIVSKPYDYYIGLGTVSSSPTQVQFCTFDTSAVQSCTSFFNIGYNSWHHVVGTFDNLLSSQRLKLYIDGDLKQSANGTSNAIRQQGNAFRIGYVNGFFNGLVDDVRVYNAAIPSSEIQQNYYLGLHKLLKNNGITLNEYNQRLVELKNNLANN
jgi:prepilin-type N-terminal cleavage/methylation domain-containing protein